MKLMLIMFTMTLFSGCAANTKLYKITPVVDMADSLKCARAGGHAGLIADLDETGTPASAWIPGCILQVK